jgi:hypothetical protein
MIDLPASRTVMRYAVIQVPGLSGESGSCHTSTRRIQRIQRISHPALHSLPMRHAYLS